MLHVIIQRIKGKRGGDREHERRHVIVDESVVCDREKFQKGNSPAERERENEKKDKRLSKNSLNIHVFSSDDLFMSS